MRLFRLPLVFAAMAIALSGCSRYGANRSADFRDVFQFGVGLAHENPRQGIVPPSFGLYLQVTEFLNLGAIHFTGHAAEWDGRGLFCGPESRTRIGILPYQWLRIDQDYVNGSENYFKRSDAMWTYRMNSTEMRWHNAPAKELEYEFWADKMRSGAPIYHRGWQYWENINVELGVSEPFITHYGLNLRLGFDPSEVFDFLLGFTTFDFKHDDLTPDEYAELHGADPGPSDDIKPASTPAPPPPPPPPAPVVTPIPPSPAPPATPAPQPVAQTPWRLHEVVHFAYDVSDLTEEARGRLDSVSVELNAHPDVPVFVRGHASAEGTENYNAGLSLRRAEAVKAYLISKGIAAGRIQATARGENDPVAPNDTEPGRSQNRRAEIDATD